ncbi:CBS domain-containing protein [Pseudooceanicola sp. LIPI14-2-Ac024]|uniref:CBS domain-containing protein n=1 Tax=Pseudooceanicola sp. LIPI14-2-Ac024 TaxID=3344875 RepID=UPI0035D12117
MTERTIDAYMQLDFLSLAPDTPMKTAIARLVETGSPAAPVLDDAGLLVGVLTQKDCFAAALNSAYYQQWSGTVDQHMTPAVETMEADTDIVTAAETFQARPYRAFPVVRDDAVVGMLSRADLLGAFLALG